LSVGIVASSLFTALSTPLKPAKALPATSQVSLVEDLKAYAKARYKADEIQTSCLNTLWTMESHWNYKARGSKTSQGYAYGIAQALPASKMKTMGADYMTNPLTQIEWGLLYLKTRYQGRACWALKHELNKGWY